MAPLSGTYRRGLAALLLAAVLVGLLTAGVVALADPDAPAGRDGLPAGGRGPLAPAPAPTPVPAPAAVPVRVGIDLGRPGRAVAPAYLGLSFEASDLPRIAGYGERGNLAGLLRSLGPGLLRFGGVSADTRVAWSDAAMALPPWTSQALTPADFRRLRVLAERSGWRVLLTVGLAHYEPHRAAREVAAARRLLGRWLAGVEVGNEPDAYARHGFRGPGWGFAAYGAQVRAYRRAIARAVRGVPLAGPGVSGSHVFVRWGPREVRALHPALLTGHHYPLGCNRNPEPSVAGLLSALTRAQEAASLHRYLAVARRGRLPFRMDETNSVSCGGRAGISNTFAAALWAVSYIGQALSAGAAGVNFQGNPANCQGYSPLCAATLARLSAGALGVQPLWYAMLLARGLAGDRPLRSTLAGPTSQEIAVTVLREPGGGLAVLIADEQPPGSPPSALALQVGARRGPGRLVRLVAPSLTATTGVSLGRRRVASDGWFPARVPGARVAVLRGVATVVMEPASAALLTLPPRH